MHVLVYSRYLSNFLKIGSQYPDFYRFANFYFLNIWCFELLFHNGVNEQLCHVVLEILEITSYVKAILKTQWYEIFNLFLEKS